MAIGKSDIKLLDDFDGQAKVDATDYRGGVTLIFKGGVINLQCGPADPAGAVNITGSVQFTRTLPSTVSSSCGKVHQMRLRRVGGPPIS